MDFTNIKELLEGYRKLVFQGEERRKEIGATIFMVSGVQLLESDIQVNKGEITILGNSVIKNELFLYKEKILTALHEKKMTDITGIR